MGQESIRRVLTIALLTLPLSFACKIEEDVLPTGTVGFTLGRGVVAWFRQPQWNQQVTFLGQKRRINGISELTSIHATTPSDHGRSGSSRSTWNLRSGVLPFRRWTRPTPSQSRQQMGRRSP